MYFTPEKLVAYIESGGIIDPSEPASNFLVGEGGARVI